MTRIIGFFNQKGGTAKTTSTLNVAAALAERGRRVLVLDLDPQASLTMATGIDVTFGDQHDLRLGQADRRHLRQRLLREHAGPDQLSGPAPSVHVSVPGDLHHGAL